jgi:transposase
MPYLSEKIKIEGTKFDRRVKLTPEDKELIKTLSETEGLSQRKLALRFSVSRRLIQFVLQPSKLEECLKRRQERGGWKQYYNKEVHSEVIKEHRQYKEDLKKKGLIKQPDTF